MFGILYANRSFHLLGSGNKELLNYSIVFILYFVHDKKNVDLYCLFIILDIVFKDSKAT